MPKLIAVLSLSWRETRDSHLHPGWFTTNKWRRHIEKLSKLDQKRTTIVKKRKDYTFKIYKVNAKEPVATLNHQFRKMD